MESLTLLVALSHPDDELGVAGTIMAQRARGDRVVIVWLSSGEQTEAYGPIPIEEVALRRQALGHRSGEIMGAETIFLDFPDTAITHDRSNTLRLAELICELKPDGIITWGEAWVRGFRHPDHQATGRLFRDAITLARMAKIVSPSAPHRRPCPVFTLRDVHSTLPIAGVDVTPFREQIGQVADLYRQGVGFGDQDWLERRLRGTGERWGVTYAGEFDAWESSSSSMATILPANPLDGVAHPDRVEGRKQ